MKLKIAAVAIVAIVVVVALSGCTAQAQQVGTLAPAGWPHNLVAGFVDGFLWLLSLVLLLFNDNTGVMASPHDLVYGIGFILGFLGFGALFGGGGFFIFGGN